MLASSVGGGALVTGTVRFMVTGVSLTLSLLSGLLVAFSCFIFLPQLDSLLL
jgi:hypothetical protein